MIKFTNENDQLSIAVFSENTKKLNVIIADTVKNELNAFLDQGCNNLIVDFSNIMFIDSSGFGALVTVFNHAKNIGSRVILTNISEETMELVKITKLDQVFDIFATNEDAKKEII